jgi:hypothetical protein
MDITELFAKILEPFKEGARSTADAFEQDVESVSEGKAPAQAMKAGGQVLSHMASPSVNPTIPAMQYLRRAFDPQRGWYTVEDKMYPGGDWITMMMRTGNFGPFLETLLRNMEKAR